MTDLTKLTVNQLRAEILVPENGVTFAEATNELARRAQANDLVQAERDEFDEELHTCRAIVRATSEHLHVDLEEMVDKLRRTEADAHSWQELATARAQATDALRSVAEDVYEAIEVGTVTDELRAQLADVLNSLERAAPAPSSSGAPAPEAQPEPAKMGEMEVLLGKIDDALGGHGWTNPEDVLVRAKGVVAQHKQRRRMDQKLIDQLMADVEELRKPAPADSQREAAIRDEDLVVTCGETLPGGQLRDKNMVTVEHVTTGMGVRCSKHKSQGKNKVAAVEGLRAILRSAPVAPVTDAEVGAAIRAYRSECIAPPEDDACEDEAFGYLRSLIARRVAEARGAGLRELRARLVDFCRIRDRGYDVRSDFSPLWVLDEIDRLLAAPAASKLAEEPAQKRGRPTDDAVIVRVVVAENEQLSAEVAEEPAQESKTDLSWRSELADLKRVTHAEWLRHDKLIVAIHAQVEAQARRIEALERAAQGGDK